MRPAVDIALATLLVSTCAASQVTPPAANNKPGYRFLFGSGAAPAGYVRAVPAQVYTAERGYGFAGASAVTVVERGGKDPLRSAFCTSPEPFFFSVRVPEGNYRVTVTLGDRDGVSTTTVKAEARRLLLENVHTARGGFEVRSFTVNVRTSALASGDNVHLKRDEIGHLDWDDELTLEFSGTRPCLDALEICPVDGAVTVFIAG